MSTPFDFEEAIFSAARQRSDPQARATYLHSACAGDDALRVRIEERLRALEPADVPAPPVQARAPVLEPLGLVQEEPGSRIGHYELVKLLGEGGFGVVWLAEQFEPVRRQVALKVIKWGMDTRQVVARFEAERQALALMDHPNIAKVFDAGATASGRPYFVMELVQGTPINQVCDRRRLPIPERLTLFMQVCHALQHAHHKGIVHRDIKPSNVLVAEQDGIAVPKVIDFGIAKAIEQQLTEKTLVTAPEQYIGTPRYMSPEQAGWGGLDIDTRTDVYSLGVLLYELVTGKTPFESPGADMAGWDELWRQIREGECRRPSSRLATLPHEQLALAARRRGLSPRALQQSLRGDLDWIIMKALEKDRTRRYATAAALADDLQRYLVHEPVEAAAPSTVYRFRKFARRNRAAFASVGAIVVILIAGVVASTGWAMRARRAEHEAEAALRSARLEAGRNADAVRFIRALCSDSLILAKQVASAETLEAVDGSEFVRKFATNFAQNARELKKDPELRALVLTWAGWMCGDLRDYGMAEKLHREALSAFPPGLIHSNLFHPQHGIAIWLHNRGKYTESVVEYAKALQIAEATCGESLIELVSGNYRNALCVLQRWREADEMLERQLHRCEAKGPEAQGARANYLRLLAEVASERCKRSGQGYVPAAAVFERAKAAGVGQMHRTKRGEFLRHYGRILIALGRLSDAEKELRAAVKGEEGRTDKNAHEDLLLAQRYLGECWVEQAWEALRNDRPNAARKARDAEELLHRAHDEVLDGLGPAPRNDLVLFAKSLWGGALVVLAATDDQSTPNARVEQLNKAESLLAGTARKIEVIRDVGVDYKRAAYERDVRLYETWARLDPGRTDELVRAREAFENAKARAQGGPAR